MRIATTISLMAVFVCLSSIFFGTGCRPQAESDSSTDAPASKSGPYTLDKATADRAAASLALGESYLLKTQNEDGSWGTHKHPAIAALCAMALTGPAGPLDKKAVDKALDYCLTFAQEDGSIYPAARDKGESANYPNYTTSIVLLALAAVNRVEDLDAMKKAREYLKHSQFNDPDKVDYGGLGYGKTGRADLSNLSWAVEALHVTEYLDREPYSKDPEAGRKTERMHRNMAIFLGKCQNLKDDGGLFYRPGESKAGNRAGEGNVTYLISSGSMTYAGLKSMIYAKLDRDDIRVRGAMRYAMRHYTLEENPGMGMQGYYYYLLSMTKAFRAYGTDILKGEDGTAHDWRKDIVSALVSRQNDDGSWTNTHGRYMESLPELATPYSMICMRTTLTEQSVSEPL